MAATQVARNSSFNGFDDFVKMPSSPTLQPRNRALSNATVVAVGESSTAKPTHNAAVAVASTSSSSSASAFNMRKVGLDENQPTPPHGSSPEVFFRYYLAVELRKAGTQPSEALLDRYVRNHFDSLFKNKGASAGPTPASSAPAPVVAAAQPTITRAQPHASTSQVTVAAVAPPPPPQAKAAPVPVPASVQDTASPPELGTAESPALSGRSYSPVAAPPALNSIGDDDALVDFSTVFGEPSSSLLKASSHAMGTDTIKFEDDSDQMLGFFRNSPFRTTHLESATIDPHVVENGAATLQNAYTMPLTSISPSDLSNINAAQPASQQMTFSASQSSLKVEATPMSEDGMSDGDEHDDDDGHSRQGLPSKGFGSKTLSTIPMAVGDINYLKPDPEEYKKLSSKEKRQLRNKISARNFRTRRKEYITQLEDQIADRDTLIEGLRQQISQLSVENKSLKDEVKTIKARTISSQDVGKILEALQTMTSTTTATTTMGGGLTSGRTSPTQEFGSGNGPLTPGAFLNFGNDVAPSSSRPSTPTLAVPSSPRSQSPRPSLLRRSSPSLMSQPNTKKDVAPQSSFWGGVGSVNGGNTFMPVC